MPVNNDGDTVTYYNTKTIKNDMGQGKNTVKQQANGINSRPELSDKKIYYAKLQKELGLTSKGITTYTNK